jgi:predicted metalloprotease with PDZ domain
MRDASSASLSDAAKGQRLPTMQTYWSGAALMLMADARLREVTDGAQSLDTALTAFAACCTEPRRSWRAREVLERLDDITGTRIFSDLYADYADRPGFPPVEPVYAALGLVRDGRRVRLTDGAPLAGIRSAIMRG